MAAKHDWPELHCSVPPEIHARLKRAASERGWTLDIAAREAIACGLHCVERPLVGTGAGAGTGAR